MCKEIKIENKTIIPPNNTEEIKTDTKHSLNKSFTDNVSQPLQKGHFVKSDCEVKSKLGIDLQRLSSENPANVTKLPLGSEQYLRIFNRYQVFQNGLIIFNYNVKTFIIILYCY